MGGRCVFIWAALPQPHLQDTVYNCQTDPTGNATLAPSPLSVNSRGDGGPAAWVWVLVGLAAVAGVSTVAAAVLLFRRRRLRRSGAAAKAALPGGPPSSALVLVGQADPDSLGSKQTASPRQSSGDKVKEDDLEMVSAADLVPDRVFPCGDIAWHEGSVTGCERWPARLPCLADGQREAAILAGRAPLRACRMRLQCALHATAAVIRPGHVSRSLAAAWPALASKRLVQASRKSDGVLPCC